MHISKILYTHIGVMAASVGNSSGKKLIRIDVSSDTVCPWCFVGKKYLDKAIAASKDQYDFEVLLFLSLSLPLPSLSFSLMSSTLSDCC